MLSHLKIFVVSAGLTGLMSGCSVLSATAGAAIAVGGAATSAAITVGGAAAGAAIDVGGKVVGKAVDAITSE
jgi:hypothetical protein